MSTNITEPDQAQPVVAHPFTEGSLVTITAASVSGDAEVDETAAVVGREYTVFSYAEGAESDDPNGRPYYLLDGPHSIGGECWAYPEEVALSKSAEQLAARKLPTPQEIADALGSGAMSAMTDDLDFNGADRASTSDSYEASFIVYGTTSEGLGFSARVTVDQIGSTDD